MFFEAEIIVFNFFSDHQKNSGEFIEGEPVGRKRNQCVRRRRLFREAQQLF